MNPEQAEIADSYNSLDYWNKRYNNHPDIYDWLCNYKELKEYLAPYKKCRILIVGNGSSILPLEMANDGFENLTVTDYSETALKVFKEHCTVNIDVAQLDLLNNSEIDKFKKNAGLFDIIFDKAVFDCFAANRHSLETVTTYLIHMAKLLRVNGQVILASCADSSLRVSLFKTPQVVQHFTNATSSPDNNESYVIAHGAPPSSWYLYGLFKVGSGSK